MHATVMTIKTDPELKEKASQTARDLGFPLGTLINAFLRQFVRNKAVFFSVEPTQTMSHALERELGKIEKDIQKEINLSPGFKNMKDALKYLKKS